MRDIINKSISKCMQDNLHMKNYVKFIRTNKKFKPIKYNRYYKDGISLQFQNDNKCTLVIPKRCGMYHIQIHLDKYFQLVKFMKIRIKKRYEFINQTNRFTRKENER